MSSLLDAYFISWILLSFLNLRNMCFVVENDSEFRPVVGTGASV